MRRVRAPAAWTHFQIANDFSANPKKYIQKYKINMEYVNFLLCLFNFHEYSLKYQKIKTTSIAGDEEVSIECRVCDNCGKRQVETNFGWETI